jgi:hypothetical protein
LDEKKAYIVSRAKADWNRFHIQHKSRKRDLAHQILFGSNMYSSNLGATVEGWLGMEWSNRQLPDLITVYSGALYSQVLVAIKITFIRPERWR